MMRKVGWGTMAVLSTLVALYALMLIVVPLARPPFLRERFETVPLAAYLHLFGSALALAVGSFQHHARLRARYLNAHRWTGRVYVVGVLIGGFGSLILATVSQFGMITHLGFGLLAVLWLGTTTQAWLRIRAGDEQGHQRWMTRSFALTLAAVTLRIYLPFGFLAPWGFAVSYQVISWLSWVPNLLIAELLIYRREQPTGWKVRPSES